MMTKVSLENYLEQIKDALAQVQITTNRKKLLKPAPVLEQLSQKLKGVKSGEKKIIFIGNGGSAAISGHMAEDYTKVGGMRAICFNDAPFLTCLGNDYSFEQIFEKAIGFQADRNDILVAISSSGRSANILNGVKAGRVKKCYTVTLSGFKPDNPLRHLGDLNIYLPTSSYGITELSHEIILHYLLDKIVSPSQRLSGKRAKT